MDLILDQIMFFTTGVIIGALATLTYPRRHVFKTETLTRNRQLAQLISYTDGKGVKHTYELKLDPSTGRAYGDHGTERDAIDYILDEGVESPDDFLVNWKHRTLHKYPDYYKWLNIKGR